MPILLNNVNYIYGIGSGYDKHALKNINVVIEEGEFIGIAGHTGSGKSTLVQILSGLLEPTSGTVYYNGQDIHDKGFDKKPFRGKIGLVFQYPEHQLFEVTVFADVCFGPKNMGLDKLETEFRAYQALKQVGIGEELLDASVFELSGGQKRRVAIAGVLAMKPEILILDEPTAGLDPLGRDEILGLLRELYEKEKMSIIMISHRMEDVGKYAKRLLVMNHGKIVLDGKPENIFSYEKELEEIDLGVPQVTKVMNRLNSYGDRSGEACLTVSQAADEIIQWLKR